VGRSACWIGLLKPCSTVHCSEQKLCDCLLCRHNNMPFILTSRNMGPNQVKKMKSKGLLVRSGETIGFLREASRLAFALLSFLVSDRLSASMRLCRGIDQHLNAGREVNSRHSSRMRAMLYPAWLPQVVGIDGKGAVYIYRPWSDRLNNDLTGFNPLLLIRQTTVV